MEFDKGESPLFLIQALLRTPTFSFREGRQVGWSKERFGSIPCGTSPGRILGKLTLYLLHDIRHPLFLWCLLATPSFPILTWPLFEHLESPPSNLISIVPYFWLVLGRSKATWWISFALLTAINWRSLYIWPNTLFGILRPLLSVPQNSNVSWDWIQEKTWCLCWCMLCLRGF